MNYSNDAHSAELNMDRFFQCYAFKCGKTRNVENLIKRIILIQFT